MGNRRATEKLSIPEWFRLANYLPLEDLMKPSDWLQQIAFRIDLMSLLNKLGPLTERPEESVFVDEFLSTKCCPRSNLPLSYLRWR